MQLYNTLSRRLEPFAPAGPTMTMYVCGVTPYDTTHLGHGRCYLVYDLLQRYVRYLGHDVRYVQNVTDVDDDLLRKAAELGQPYDQVAAENLDILRRDMEALNVLPPAVWPRATQEVPGMLKIARALVGKGQAYERGGNVYFRARSAPDFGSLSRRTRDEMIARLREERFDPDDPRKDDPLDILMWQAAAPGEPTWESPWGPGRPGWHIECTAMALRHLGNTIDVHGGGEDLIFSHHESERAQAESYTGARPFVRFWVYAGTVYAGQEKMSKSLRNLVLVRELLERYSGDAIRLYLAREHYRAHLTYEEAGLAEAAELVARLRAAAALAAPGEGPAPGSGEPPEVPPSDDFRARFEAAMDADLDTPGAVEVLRDLAAAVEVDRTSGVALARAMLLNELASVLGLRLAGQPGTVWPR
ncbi:MAG TPA: cysteine--tRNA ligase [Chloroflexota bacterium]|jgi:L-cysteine:1D-myo-inositol 2-amino-2-deoxy-alpha-D-glucopyranoside ligase